jgi:hypothetical protein
MANRTTVDFSENIAPIFKKYANTYGVKNTCSLGAILIDQLTSDDRETLMGLIASDESLMSVYVCLKDVESRHFQALYSLSKRRNKRIYVKKR